MSRIGRMPINIPAGVTLAVSEENTVTVTGPKGTLSERIPALIKVDIAESVLTVSRPDDEKKTKALHGLSRSLIANMVIGVTDGFKKQLEINGVGYRAQKQGNQLIMNLGYSHNVVFEEPDGITFEVPQPTVIVVSGASKQKVGQLASEIRGKRPPEPYLGKGVKYAGEKIRRKAGKAGK